MKILYSKKTVLLFMFLSLIPLNCLINAALYMPKRMAFGMDVTMSKLDASARIKEVLSRINLLSQERLYDNFQVPEFKYLVPKFVDWDARISNGRTLLEEVQFRKNLNLDSAKANIDSNYIAASDALNLVIKLQNIIDYLTARVPAQFE